MNNVFEIEPILIEKLEATGLFSAVKSWTDFLSIVESPTANAKNKACYILYKGDELNSTNKTQIISDSSWAFVIVVKKQQNAREEAGALIGGVISAIQGFKPDLDGWGTFTLDGGIGADYLDGGIALFTVHVSARHVLNGVS